MRLAAIDFGKARIGIAITDESGKIALPLKTIEAASSLKELALKLLEELKTYKLSKIIVGLPLLLNGTKGKMALLVEEFVKVLQSLTPIPIELFDERFTTAMAERSLKEIELSRKKRAKYIDTSAAVFILRDYISTPKNVLKVDKNVLF